LFQHLAISAMTLSMRHGQIPESHKRAQMIGMGLHVFYPEYQGDGRILSPSFKDVTLKILGSDETLMIPCQVCTQVGDVRQALATQLSVQPDSLSFIVKQASTYRKLRDTDEIRSTVTVKGISTFKPQAFEWPHPTAIIGSGYHGLKTMMLYMKSGNENFVAFDRNDRVGGYCWITAANQHSKLQTEFSAFHVWWGPESQHRNCQFPDASWGAWPGKAKVLEHFQFAAEQFGILPHIQFRCNVSQLTIVGDKKSDDRAYDLTVVPHDKKQKASKVRCSALWNYPGSMQKNRIVEYPGEDVFDGQIGYGMNDDCQYESFQDDTITILGNGAFAVENARTCLEQGAKKVFLLTRRKNLASPRIPCWFVHQGPEPTPAAFVLKLFEPMYNVADFGDPFAFYAVTSNTERSKCQVTQSSRFGIGDVTFLAMACGVLEFVVDTLKRCTRRTLHLTSGRRLEDVGVIVKCLGLLGDFEVDRFHDMTAMTGFYCGGDWRRVLFIDATGMNASNFGTFSTGQGTNSYVNMTKFMFDHPAEYKRAAQDGMLDQLPKNRARMEEEKPAYIYDVNYTNVVFVTMGAFLPKSQEVFPLDADYKYRLTHAVNPIDKMLRECKEAWDEYQATWRERGITEVDHVEYPYTKEMIQGWFFEWNKLMGRNVSNSIAIEGPRPEELEAAGGNRPAIGGLPPWASDTAAIQSVEETVKPEFSKWWQTNSNIGVQKPGSKR